MTFPQSTTPAPDTVAAPRASGDDPFGLDQIPDFLRRTPGKTKRATRSRTVWHVTACHLDRLGNCGGPGAGWTHPDTRLLRGFGRG